MCFVLLYGLILAEDPDVYRDFLTKKGTEKSVPFPIYLSIPQAKDAMEGISKILTKEARADNIGVCNVYPGGVDTNFRPKANPNYLRPETVAKMIRTCIEVEDGCVHDIVLRPFIEENIP